MAKKKDTSSKSKSTPIASGGPRQYIDPTDDKEYSVAAKTAMAQGYNFMNPAIRRMYDPNLSDRSYTFTGEEFDYDFNRPVGVPAGETGTHYIADEGNIVWPFIEEDSTGKLNFNEHANPQTSKEAIYFNSPEEASYFAGNYKKFTPYMSSGGNIKNTMPNFKSNAAYKKWLAYGHASGEFAKTPGNQSVSIKGKSKKVKHANEGKLPKYPIGGGLPEGYVVKGSPEHQAYLDAQSKFQNYNKWQDTSSLLSERFGGTSPEVVDWNTINQQIIYDKSHGASGEQKAMNELMAKQAAISSKEGAGGRDVKIDISGLMTAPEGMQTLRYKSSDAVDLEGLTAERMGGITPLGEHGGYVYYAGYTDPVNEPAPINLVDRNVIKGTGKLGGSGNEITTPVGTTYIDEAGNTVYAEPTPDLDYSKYTWNDPSVLEQFGYVTEETSTTPPVETIPTSNITSQFMQEARGYGKSLDTPVANTVPTSGATSKFMSEQRGYAYGGDLPKFNTGGRLNYNSFMQQNAGTIGQAGNAMGQQFAGQQNYAEGEAGTLHQGVEGVAKSLPGQFGMFANLAIAGRNMAGQAGESIDDERGRTMAEGFFNPGKSVGKFANNAGTYFKNKEIPWYKRAFTGAQLAAGNVAALGQANVDIDKMNAGKEGLEAYTQTQQFGDAGRRFAMGGDVTQMYGGGVFNEYVGPRHENGGIDAANNGVPVNQSTQGAVAEVEGGETSLNERVFSDRIVAEKNGKKIKTYADLSKAIKKRYPDAEKDKIAKDSMERELDDLYNQQESFKSGDYTDFAAYGGKLSNHPPRKPKSKDTLPPKAYDGGYSMRGIIHKFPDGGPIHEKKTDANTGLTYYTGGFDPNTSNKNKGVPDIESTDGVTWYDLTPDQRKLMDHYRRLDDKRWNAWGDAIYAKYHHWDEGVEEAGTSAMFNRLGEQADKIAREQYPNLLSLYYDNIEEDKEAQEKGITHTNYKKSFRNYTYGGGLPQYGNGDKITKIPRNWQGDDYLYDWQGPHFAPAGYPSVMYGWQNTPVQKIDNSKEVPKMPLDYGKVSVPDNYISKNMTNDMLLNSGNAFIGGNKKESIDTGSQETGLPQDEVKPYGFLASTAGDLFDLGMAMQKPEENKLYSTDLTSPKLDEQRRMLERQAAVAKALNREGARGQVGGAAHSSRIIGNALIADQLSNQLTQSYLTEGQMAASTENQEKMANLQAQMQKDEFDRMDKAARRSTASKAIHSLGEKGQGYLRDIRGAEVGNINNKMWFDLVKRGKYSEIQFRDGSIKEVVEVDGDYYDALTREKLSKSDVKKKK